MEGHRSSGDNADRAIASARREAAFIAGLGSPTPAASCAFGWMWREYGMGLKEDDERGWEGNSDIEAAALDLTIVDPAESSVGLILDCVAIRRSRRVPGGPRSRLGARTG